MKSNFQLSALKAIKCIIMLFLTTGIVFSAYINISYLWVNCGGFLKGKILYFEMPFLLFLAFLLYFPAGFERNQVKKCIQGIILVQIPILSLYILHDAFYSFLGESPRISDLKNICSLFDFSPMLWIILILYLLFILSIILFLGIRYKKNVAFKKFSVFLLFKLMLLIGVVFFLNSDAFSRLQKKIYSYYWFSQAYNIKYNGRFSSFFYYNQLRRRARVKLRKYKKVNLDVDKILYPGKIKHRRNIYIIVLESFMDPRLIVGLNYDRTPLSKELSPFLINKYNFSHVISPVFGGKTAQPEFELLTGVRALAKINSVEFNVMEGHFMPSFVNKLRKSGYYTMATIATDASFFNSKEAYKSIGFQEIDFLEENRHFQKVKGDKFIFDGTVYKYNLSKIKKLRRPFLLYTLGMYGHYPFLRNKSLRPDVIITHCSNTYVRRILNQFYYRTKSLAFYIKNILKNDHNSIIYVTGDHIPPMVLSNKIRYKKEKHITISLMLVDGKAKKVSGKRYYEIPWEMWDELIGYKNRREIDKKKMEEIYFKILSDSIS
jgi:phosphoglycerol transferase MdoB-like AlkP superfamily enzyme